MRANHFINSQINLFFGLGGRIFGSIYKNSSPKQKKEIIKKTEASLQKTTPAIYGRAYHFFYEFVRTISQNEKEIIIDFEIMPRVSMALDVKQKTQKLIYLQRPYEASIRSYLEKTLMSGDIFIDIGANVGYYTLLASPLVGKKGGVIAFEPEKENFKTLEKNILINGFKNIQALNMAAGMITEERNLYLNPLNEGGHSLNVMNNYRDNQKVMSKEESKKAFPNFKSTQKVQTTSVDSYIAKYPHIENISLVKIDVEGFEGEVIKGMKELIENKKVKAIICEISDTNSPVIDVFRKNLYSVYIFQNEGLKPLLQSEIGKKGNYLFVLNK